MKVITTTEEMSSYSREAWSSGRTVVLVPTMGCLHRGHRELLKKGRAAGDLLVLSIFVNPTQFGPNEDFKSYPRQGDRDLEVARSEGVDCVFMPEAEEIYPPGFTTYVTVDGPMTEVLCGRSRPGHFRGVTTVVAKLFNIVRPHRAVFGRKDYQQLKVIERMTRDLDLGVEIIPVDTVREAGGLAMSSRNTYLGDAEREAALAIHSALDAATRAYGDGERSPAAIVEKMKKIIEKEPLVVVEYVEVRDPETLGEIDEIGPSGAVAAVAARVGAARLIDNRLLGPAADGG